MIHSGSPSIPVFVSCPARLSLGQSEKMDFFHRLTVDSGLTWQRLGSTHYTAKSPFQAINELIQASYGGLVLGFETNYSDSVVFNAGTDSELTRQEVSRASPWNQIEAAMLAARNLPMLVLKDSKVTEGVFDHGVGSWITHCLSDSNVDEGNLHFVFKQWAELVRRRFENDNSIFDVFISFSGEDEASARVVFEFLTSQGLRVFFSRQSIPNLAQADYMKAINEAVDKARHMVVVSSSASGFAKPWVEREWTMFLNEKLS